MGLLLLALVGSALAAQVISRELKMQHIYVILEVKRGQNLRFSTFSGLATNPSLATGCSERSGSDCWRRGGQRWRVPLPSESPTKYINLNLIFLLSPQREN